VLFQGGVVDSEAVTVALNRTRPSMDSHLPSSQGLHLVRHGDVGVQVGVAGAGIAVRERGARPARDVDLADALGAFRVYRAWSSM
jgi:hypothetical protein